MYEYSIDTGYVLVKKEILMIKTLPLKKASIKSRYKSLYKKAPVKKNRIKKARIKKAAAMGQSSHGSVRFC